MTKYLPVNGTWGADDGWVTSDGDPFSLFMRGQRFEPIRNPDGSPWTWNGKVNGLLWYGTQDWKDAADSLEALLTPVPYEDRNLFGHSHGGNPVLLLAARGFAIRSLTTIGTPRRHDMPAVEASHHIAIWQHIYDKKWDWMATMRRLGGIGDGKVSLDRHFDIPGVRNIPIGDISHSTMLNDPTKFHLWIENGILDRIRLA